MVAEETRAPAVLAACGIETGVDLLELTERPRVGFPAAPVDAHEVELEDHRELAPAGVHEERRVLDRDPGCLADGDGVVGGQDLAVHLLEELMHPRSARPDTALVPELFGREIGQTRLLRDERDDVHAEPRNALVQPETHEVVHLATDVIDLPVEVRLLHREVVEVPLVGVLVVLPCRPAEEGAVVVRRSAVLAVPPDVPIAFRVVARRTALHEPRVLVAAVVHHEVDDQPDSAFLQCGKKPVEVLHRPELGHDAPVVAHVVSVVGVRAVEVRAQPHGVDSETGNVVDPGDDAVDVADPVPVRVHEGPRIDLVHDCVLPPRMHCHVPIVRQCPRWTGMSA